MENLDFVTGVLIPYANMALFAVLLYILAKKPILGMLSSKKEDYVRLVDQANASKEEAEQKQQQLAAKLHKLDSEIKDIHSRAKNQAEQEAEEIISSAKKLADHLQSEARRIAEAELENAKSELRREIAISAQQKVLEKIKDGLTPDHHKSIFKQQMDDISSIGGKA